jgi:hypothetical protein
MEKDLLVVAQIVELLHHGRARIGGFLLHLPGIASPACGSRAAISCELGESPCPGPWGEDREKESEEAYQELERIGKEEISMHPELHSLDRSIQSIHSFLSFRSSIAIPWNRSREKLPQTLKGTLTVLSCSWKQCN